jgi:threonine dehydratase
VICSSAGNHGQGVALAGSRLGVRSVIVMPETTPRIKVEAVRALGGEVVLHGYGYDDAFGRAQQLANEQALTFVHPFNDPAVIAGQGTIGMEILRQQREHVDAIFVPVGGGGLASGIALYVKALYPQTKVYGVSPADSPGMVRALAAGEPVTLPRVGSFADGVAVRRVGSETFRICRELLDGMIQVSTDEICAAIRDIFEDTRAVVEPAGALGVAGIKRWLADYPQQGATLVAINSGANVNFDRLRYIAERADAGEQREALLGVEIPERAGSFLAFCEALGRRSITEFNYRYADTRTARIFVGVELKGGAVEREELIGSIRAAGFPVTDLSDDEMAKLHVRHMVGGVGTGVTNERLLRCEYPEYPGALLDFLRTLGTRWNISLFHYRNHGSDFGRVLAGLQVPEAEHAGFLAHLAGSGYPWRDESENPGYRLFLSGQ